MLQTVADMEGCGEELGDTLKCILKNDLHGFCRCLSDHYARGGEWGGVLVFAVKLGRSEMVHALLQRNVDVNGVDSDKNTALHAAAETGNIDILKSLLATGKCLINIYIYTQTYLTD